MISYDSDKFWISIVQKQLKERGFANVEMRFLAQSVIDEVKNGTAQKSDVASAVGEADIIIIDHNPNVLRREAVAQYALNQLRSTQLIVLDNPEWNPLAWKLLEDSMLGDFVGLRKRPYPDLIAANQRAVAFNTGTSMYFQYPGFKSSRRYPKSPSHCTGHWVLGGRKKRKAKPRPKRPRTSRWHGRMESCSARQAGSCGAQVTKQECCDNHLATDSSSSQPRA